MKQPTLKQRRARERNFFVFSLKGMLYHVRHIQRSQYATLTEAENAERL
jgi:hypothetical protein